MRMFISGVDVTPNDAKNLGFVCDFTERNGSFELNFDRLKFSNEGYKFIKTHWSNYGAFHGLPILIQMNNGTSYDYYIDLTENPLFTDRDVEVSIKKRKGGLDFWSKSDGASFEWFVTEKGVNYNYIQVPYVIVPEGQREQAITLAITLFTMTRELIAQVRKLADLAGETAGAIASSALLNPGLAIMLALKLVAQLVYVALLIIAIIKLSKELKELIFPKVRYFKACSYLELLRKSCEALNYTFVSELLESEAENGFFWSILPIPLQAQPKKWFEFLEDDIDNSMNKHYPTENDSTPLLTDLFDLIETQFNGKTRVVDNVVRFERRDWWENNATQQINPALSLQSEREDGWTYNLEEQWKRYVVSFDSDISDIHTFDSFTKGGIEISTEQTLVFDEDLVSIKGYQETNKRIQLVPATSEIKLLSAFVLCEAVSLAVP